MSHSALVTRVPVPLLSLRALGDPGALLKLALLGFPAWWLLGVSFMMPMALCGALILARPSAHQSFTAEDCLLASIVLVLVASAYVNGFLVAQSPLRFLAALYNALIWLCGLVLAQQIRALVRESDAARAELLRVGYLAFVMLVTLALAANMLAYARHVFDLQAPSLLGAFIGDKIPDTAVLIKQSTTVLVTKADWGLPGVPMPRIGIYGPYPNSTAAVAAVLGTLALLHMQDRARHRLIITLGLEAAATLTVALTLSRATLGGWLAGMVLGNLVFGTRVRQLLSGAALVVVALSLVFTNVTEIGSYRQYSTESRFDNYVRAFVSTVEENPVLGLGIKPREEISHIAVGSHSTFVSAFTKGGAVGLALVVGYLVALPALRWARLMIQSPHLPERRRADLRHLFTLQVTLWAWMGFEDLDAPAMAAMLIYIAFALRDELSRSPHALSFTTPRGVTWR